LKKKHNFLQKTKFSNILTSGAELAPEKKIPLQFESVKKLNKIFFIVYCKVGEKDQLFFEMIKIRN
jgi:hypothetical protein